MAGGGKTPDQKITTTSTQTNLPEYARPFVENIMYRAQDESYRPYQEFPGERIEPFTAAQQQTQQQAMGLQTPGQFGTATNFATAAGLGSLAAGQYAPNQFGAQQVGGPNLNQYSMSAPQMFGVEQAQQYMSPYAQNVMDVQKREAIRDAQQSQLMGNLGAARQGTYGGARQLLAGTERERALGFQLGDIQARGQQAAYENAQQQFERDRTAGMTAGQQNLQSALQTQQLGTQTGLQALLANQQSNLEAQRLGEQSRQFGSTMGLQGYGQMLEAGRTLGNLGTTQQQSDIQRLQAQSAVGAEQQAMGQRQMDLDYADFLRQRDYPMEQLGYFSNIIRGMPMTMGSTATTYAPPPSMASQVGGLGLGALGLYNMAK